MGLLWELVENYEKKPTGMVRVTRSTLCNIGSLYDYLVLFGLFDVPQNIHWYPWSMKPLVHSESRVN